MTWQSVGQHTFVPTDRAVQIGSFDLAPGQDTIWVRITQLNSVDDWPWSYGILSWRNANGTPLGSIKAYSNRLGEVFRLGNGLPPSDGTGSIWFEPRGFNLGWLKAGFPWELQFEAQAGASDLTSGYWNRDSVNGVITPKVSGDNLDMTPGWIKAKNLILTDGTGSPVQKEVPGYAAGSWDPGLLFSDGTGPTAYQLREGWWVRVGNLVTCGLALQLGGGFSGTGDAFVSGLPFLVDDSFQGTSLEGGGSSTFVSNLTIENLTPIGLAAAAGSTQCALFRKGSISVTATDIGSGFNLRAVINYLTGDAWAPVQRQTPLQRVRI